MNYQEAFEILEIDTTDIRYNNISLIYIKNKYHKMALQNHPDKNGNTLESNEKFQKINEAYHYLKRELDSQNLNQEDSSSFVYIDLLKLFMKTTFDGKYTEILLKVVDNIINGFNIHVIDSLLEEFDYEKCILIYNFLSRYRSILHLSQEILDRWKEIIIKKYEKNILSFKLNPSINDLLNNNLYKLHVDKQLFLVPLWYNEVYFDGSGCEIIVTCEPELPDFISIDDDNNIYTEKTVLFEKIMSEKEIIIEIGEKNFKIPIDDLYIRKEQYYRIKNHGLSKIKKDIYDVSEKADIIVKLSILF
jgi:hypothetical protein